MSDLKFYIFNPGYSIENKYIFPNETLIFIFYYRVCSELETGELYISVTTAYMVSSYVLKFLEETSKSCKV